MKTKAKSKRRKKLTLRSVSVAGEGLRPEIRRLDWLPMHELAYLSDETIDALTGKANRRRKPRR